MNDLYQQLDNQNPRKVKPRTSDGFTSLPAHVEEDRVAGVHGQVAPRLPLEAISESVLKDTPADRSRTVEGEQAEVSAAQSPEFIVETSKSKLLTLEIGIRQELDQLLFEHQEVSWDTVVESALINSFNNQNSKKRLVKLAAERLNARKKTAVHKRSKTMAQKYI